MLVYLLSSAHLGWLRDLHSDANGNMLGKGGVTYRYDSSNRLTSVVSGTLVATFEYNPDGLRTGMTVNGVKTSYLWDVNASLPVILTDTSSIYIYGLSLLARQTGDTVEYYHSDALGGVRNLTNGSGQGVGAYDYEPFGEPLSASGSSTNSFLYAGQLSDQQSGLYYLRARYYPPETGRFITRDSFSGYPSQPQSLNAYSYGYNNPVIYRDPTGHYLDAGGNDIGPWYLDDVAPNRSYDPWYIRLARLSPETSRAIANAYFWEWSLFEPAAGVFLENTFEQGLLFKCAYRAQWLMDPDLTEEELEAIDFEIAFTAVALTGEVGRGGKYGDAYRPKARERAQDQAKSAEPVAGEITGHYLHKPYIRKWVTEEVERRARKAPDGRFLDANTGEPINGMYDLGHKYGLEYWRLRNEAEAKGMTQQEFNELLNDPDFYQIENPASNRSHQFEMK